MNPAAAARSLRILLVEDDAEQRQFAATALRQSGFAVTEADQARPAVAELNAHEFDAVLCDLRLPDMSGAELLRYVRLFREDIAFVMFTGVNDVPTAVQSMREGADEYLLKPADPDRLTEGLLSAVQRRAQEMERKRRARRADVAGLIGFLRGVRALVVSLEMKDTYTRDHSRKVAQAAVAMARVLPGMDQRALREIRAGALLHDVGKIGVPREILHKNGPLTAEEWQVVRQHPVFGARILQPLAKSYPEVQRIVRHEHERWDGRGYPDGLAGGEIPLGSRLVMVADTYDAVCSTRAYRKALGKEHALAVIREGAGTQFDPALVPVFEGVLPELPAPRG